MKKILVCDDSALMRRLMCDIIKSDSRFHVEDVVKDGIEAYEHLKEKSYDAVILDVNMPRMTGLELLAVLQKEHIRTKTIMVSTVTKEGAKETIEALELGAFDFVTKPENYIEAKGENFRDRLLSTLVVATELGCEPEKREQTSASGDKKAKSSAIDWNSLRVGRKPKEDSTERTEVDYAPCVSGTKIVALACSTGGPKSLQDVIPLLPKNLDASIVLVQHMPAGFTNSLAARLNDLSEITVKEAEDGEELKKGWVYIAPGGTHLMVEKKGSTHRIKISHEPPRDALRPCANYMYESLMDSNYEEVVCVVLTGMGADGTKGIQALKRKKKIHVIAQDAQTCVVYGMPRMVAEAGLVNEVVPLTKVADAIVKNVGVF